MPNATLTAQPARSSNAFQRAATLQAARPRGAGLRVLTALLAACLASAGCLGTTDDDGSDGSTGSTDDDGVEEPLAREPNPEQSGTNGSCLDYNVLYEYSDVGSPVDPHVDVEPGTAWRASSPDGFVQIDFFDGNDAWLDYGTDEGSVPAGAAYGVVCVTITNEFPGAPAPAAAWTYQDGF